MASALAKGVARNLKGEQTMKKALCKVGLAMAYTGMTILSVWIAALVVGVLAIATKECIGYFMEVCQ